MPDKENNFNGFLVWILENDDFTCNPMEEKISFSSQYHFKIHIFIVAD